ncbi:endoplasmic reticulum aminopeptidase 1 [Gymnogyps californianus]|uniref:endoplasmic reticulum aminopeptidase 1 n=1 Tax=Gymnogyps californianus TaxID=33616 RepID=UPI0021C67FE7|nr:endoplasmic reticulum aminopeptidase 1 [Gymnogyps californianus]
MAALLRAGPLSGPSPAVAAGLLGLLSVALALGGDRGGSRSSSTSSTPFPWDAVRLPKHVIPLRYHLLIHPNLTTLTFAGTAAIEVTVTRQTSAVILHGKRLRVTKAAIEAGSAGLAQEARVLEHQPFEQVALLAAEPLRAGHNYTLSIQYLANLSESFHGFYKSTYRTREGELRVLAATHFEPTAARMAFPCFDEPAFKARFSVRIRREPKHLALSNMPIVKSVNINPWLVEDHFDTTVKMSTYLVAFIVSDFKSISKITGHGVKISVYTVPDKINQADYALDAAVKLLDFYEDYFGIPYPLPKQDLAAIPDFQSGAMENWGLTTYRESALLYDPEESSASSKLGVTMVIAHELAHQWFGNLVTMEWWNDLWLNEGFAKFMEFVSVSVTHPELRVEDHFLTRCFHAMAVDALNSSHPISTPVEDPAQILEMFDDVSYEKGSCILNMLRDYMTADVFKAGLVQYLQKYSYQNTKTEDLWNSLTNICPTVGTDKNELQGDGFCRRSQQSSSNAHWTKGETLDVRAMMDTWTLQKGFPLVTVTVRGKNVHLQQERYVKGVHSPSSTGYLWHIPLTYITSKSDTVQRFLMTTKADVIILPEEVEWVKFNVDMNGYYIVHYEDDGWDRLINLLKENHTVISSNDRASLISNVFQLVTIKKLPISKAFDLTLYLKHERQIMPVLQGMKELIPIHRLMERSNTDGTDKQLKDYIVNLFKDLIDKQSWSDEGSVSERLLRHLLLLFACVRRYQPCVDKAKGYFTEWQKSNGTLSLPADVKTAVYAVGAQTSEGWDFLLSKYKLQSFSVQREDIELALSFSRSKDKLQWLMDQGLRGDIVRTQDLPHIIVYVARNPSGYHLAWMFLKENWEKIVEKFELGSTSVASIVTGVTSQYSTRSQLAQVKEFFSSLEEKSTRLRCVQQAVETIEDNIQWMDRNFEKVKAWLQNNRL